ncbi:MAG: excinuclease ABC subunit UvrC [Clostridiaceae bacterium]|nr:excinuclease ABC subunit UvrC [Clostridiaceae bacterium]
MFDLQEELKKLPDKPGVYLMKDESGTIIYVGKARVLKSRVRQYFQSGAAHTPKVAAMVAKISEFEYIVTDTELESLILECNLIKELRPKFNILLKDDKNYPYIKITMNEEYPRILMTRRVDKDGAKYFGPYSNVFSVRETMNLIKKIFPIKTCKRVLPRDIGKRRPCLNYHINQCLGLCMGNVDKEEYRAVMNDVCSFLDGKQDMVIGKLEQQMLEAAEELDFERAASLRNKLSSLRHITEEQKVLSLAGKDQDIVGFAASKTDTCVQVFFVRGGKLLGREFFIIEGTGEVELNELASSFLKQFYSTATMIPGEIVIAAEPEDLDVIEEWLGSQRGGRVHLRVPKRGEKMHLVEMVSENARIELDRFNARVSGGDSGQEGLRGMSELLGLKQAPERLEAYDISNTGTSEVVASMVVFEKGLPAKKEYRRFKINSADKQNDYAAMQEVLFRRFKHVEAEKSESDKKFSRLPDLIMLDGGLGHVNAIGQVLSELEITIPHVGMVKDDKHRTRGLVLPGREIDLADNLLVLRFVTSIQDEAHRFALGYNKDLRAKRYNKSVLDEIEGVGPKRKKALIKHFGSISRIKQAGIDDLQAVEGISETVARKVYDFFN